MVCSNIVVYLYVANLSPSEKKQRIKYILLIRGRSSKGQVTNYREGGGATKRKGGHMKFYPYEKGEGG